MAKSLKKMLKAKIQDMESKTKHTFEYRDCKLTIRQNDLLEEYTEAIVNPANSELKHEGGAARAISDSSGPEFKEDCERYLKENGELPTGKAMKTRAGGKLKCESVIHAVGPRYKNRPDNSKEEMQLKDAFKSVFEIMKNYNIKSVSIPAISTGIFKYPLKKCCRNMASTIRKFIDS